MWCLQGVATAKPTDDSGLCKAQTQRDGGQRHCFEDLPVFILQPERRAQREVRVVSEPRIFETAGIHGGVAVLRIFTRVHRYPPTCMSRYSFETTAAIEHPECVLY